MIPTAFLIDFAGVPVVAIDPAKPFTRRQWTALELAWAANDDGDDRLQQHLIAAVERDIGVTERDRIHALQGDAAAADYAAQAAGLAHRDKRRRQKLERTRVKALAVEQAPRLTANQLRQLNEAERASAESAAAHRRGDHKTAGLHQTRARRLMQQVEAARTNAAARTDQERIASTTKAQAEARGEQLVTETVTAYVDVPYARDGVMADVVVQKAMRIQRVRNVSRDGLEVLRAEGGITQAQFAAGRRYRELFEQLQDGMGSQLGNIEGGAGGGRRQDDLTASPVRPAQVQRRAVLSERMADVERQVQQRSGGGPRAVLVLRDVAGRGPPDGGDRDHLRQPQSRARSALQCATCCGRGLWHPLRLDRLAEQAMIAPVSLPPQVRLARK